MLAQALSPELLAAAQHAAQPAAALPALPFSAGMLVAARGRLQPAGTTGEAEPGVPAAAPQEPSLNVILRFIGGESDDALEVWPGERVMNAKSRVCARLGISHSRVKLIHGASVLRWNDTIGASGIEEGAVITVIILPPLYQGSSAYEHVADAYRQLQAVPPSEDEVHESLEQMMEKRARLNEAFTAHIRSRGIRTA